ncbi:MAG: rhodanese-like domain-containing protein [Flavobacteriales bacterium]|jgi:rhodanese-related sulfurtransferase|nr:rhodanese-like domain-containing protein [Flavobacteriales bacterium]
MRTLSLVALSGIAMLSACGPSTKPGALPPDAFEMAITPQVQLVDVRTSSEFSSGHLKGALNLDWTSGELEAQMGSLDKDTPVLVYCASGRRSAAAREALLKAGFKDVTDLDGGVQAWTANGKPIVR